MRFETRGQRTLRAESLATIGGLLLVVACCLPLMRDGYNASGRAASASIIEGVSRPD